MTDGAQAEIDFISIIEHAAKHKVRHLKIGSFELTMQDAPREAALGAPLAAPRTNYYPNFVVPQNVPNIVPTVTGDVFAHAATPQPQQSITPRVAKAEAARRAYKEWADQTPPSRDDEADR